MSKHGGPLFAAFLLLALAQPAFAESSPKVQVATMVRSYAGMVGCLLKFDTRNIVALDHGYIALIAIDPECSGGSSMDFSAFVKVTKDGDRLFLQPDRSFPIAENQSLPPRIDHIFLKENQLWFEGRDFGEKDGLCCASIPVTGYIMWSGSAWTGVPWPLPATTPKAP